MTCARCRRRGKTWSGDDPKCAFLMGVFSPDNWRCATMDELRDAAAASHATIWTEDQWAALLPLESPEFIVLSWYKSRGRVEGAWLISEEHAEPVTLEEAEGALDPSSGRALRQLQTAKGEQTC